MDSTTAVPANSRRQQIVVQVTSGLGNQLFCYASGLGIARLLGADVSFRRSRNLIDGDRQYGLCHFRANVVEANIRQQILIGLSLQRPVNRIAKSLGKPFERRLYRIVQDDATGFSLERFTRDQNMFLRGFWQSERYFKHIESEVRAAFEFVLPPREIDRPLLEKIRATESVCVHVRRGDLVSNPLYAAKNYVMEPSYYEQAAQSLRQSGRPLHFFVFSDDADWPREHLSLGENVDFQCGDATHGREDYRDLQLMCECKHFIIANSTFSWWAAWLAKFSGKRVIAPRLWNRGSDQPKPDLIPAQWTVL